MANEEVGVVYDPPTEEELSRGAVIVRQLPSVALIEASPELELLFYADVMATEYRNEKARELQDVVLPLIALTKAMRAIDFRADAESKAKYDEARAAVRAEKHRIIGSNGVRHVLRAEKEEARADMLEAMRERLALQREVRLALWDARR